MIPVLQTILADPARNDGCDAEGRPGNCYQAAIASALELPLDEVPHFSNMDGDLWWTESNRWLRERGLVRGLFEDDSEQCPPVADCPWPCTVEPRTKLWPGAEHEAIVDRVVAVFGAGPSPRGPFRHVVVLDPQTGQMAHDPHPSRAGLFAIDEIEILFELTKEQR